ncbi:MAG: type II toxin-antitoxin system HicB family antitoxin [Nitrospinota bacterium]
MAAKRCTYTAVFEPNETGGYTVTCPALPGLVTEGRTLEEARQMAAEAIQLYLEVLKEDGLPIPPGEEHTENTIRDGVTIEFLAV